MGCWLFAHTQVRLRSLSLPANELTERGVLPIASALAVDDSLTALDISSNRVASSGAQAMREALSSNATLTILDCSSAYVPWVAVGANR